MNDDFISAALKGMKIVHLSDLHMQKFGKIENQVIKIVNQIKPDLIFLTGDYIQWKGDNQPALNFLSKLKAKYGVFAVMGDYDYSDSRNSCLFCHERGTGRPTKQHDVIMLRNSFQQIMIEDKIVKIIGIDKEYNDTYEFEKTDNVDDQDSVSLVLSHNPFAFEHFSNKDRIFMFSGDTHGGQVKFPKWMFNLFGYKKNVKYNYGLFRDGNKTIYVSKGIGTSHLKFRLFAQPEIAVFQF